MTPFLPFFSSAKDPDKSVGRVEVRGRHDGKPVERAYTYVGHIAEITGIPCLIAAKWAASGRFNVKPGGVYPPERILDDPDAFLAEVRALGVEIEFIE
ncbi:MAG: hypothetical protein M5R36_11285 [Deltaproteobacteria bacterium]|nr:hypothetical protein [Deltaproteobacteria bacterium]